MTPSGDGPRDDRRDVPRDVPPDAPRDVPPDRPSDVPWWHQGARSRGDGSTSAAGDGPADMWRQAAFGPQTAEVVGTVAEEAARLVAALSDRLAQHGPRGGSAGGFGVPGFGVPGFGASRAAGPGGPGGPATGAQDLPPIATGSAECLLCPVCQAIAAARQVQPEAIQRIAEAAAALAAAVTSAWGEATARTAPGPDARPEPPAGPRLQHIDLDLDADSEEDLDVDRDGDPDVGPDGDPDDNDA